MTYSRWRHWLCAFTWHTWRVTRTFELHVRLECDFCGHTRIGQVIRGGRVL